MIFSNNFNFVLRDSKDHFHRFFISEDNSLLLDSVNSNATAPYIIEKDILDYSVDLDKYDKIHILFLNSSGELHYRIHPSKNTERKIGDFNLKANSVRFLTIKTIKEDVHIFYMINDRHSKNWSIYHSLWHNNSWSTNKIVEVTADKLLYPYRIDCTNSNIYLFYSKDSLYTYGIKKFNLDFFIWGDLDENIELMGAHNASFLINDRNLAFICYNASVNRNLYTIVKYKDLNINSSLWSKDIPLSDASTNAVHPCMIIRNNYTYVLWEEGDALVYRKTDSGLINWIGKNTLLTKKSSVSNSIYISSHPSEPGFKSTFCPIVLDSPPYPIINIERNSDRQQFIEKEKQSRYSGEGVSPQSNITSKDEYIRELQLILIEKDKRILETIKQKETLSKELDELKSDIDNKDMEITYLQQQLLSTQEDFSNFQKEQEDRFKKLIEEMDNNSAREAAAGLTDKESTIERLNLLVNSLYQENNMKDHQIQELEQKLNRSILRKIFG